MNEFRFDVNKQRVALPGENPGKCYWRDHLRLNVPSNRIAALMHTLIDAIGSNASADLCFAGEMAREDGGELPLAPEQRDEAARHIVLECINAQRNAHGYRAEQSATIREERGMLMALQKFCQVRGIEF